MVSGGAGEEFSILVSERGLAAGFRPEQQIVDKSGEHALVVDKRTRSGPPSLGSVN